MTGLVHRSAASIRRDMEANGNDITSQLCCLEDLLDLASSSQGAYVCQEGCIQEVVCSMHRHPHTKTIQDLGCRTLEALVFWNHDSSILTEIQRAGGIERILHAMQEYPDDLSIQTKGCQAIAALALYDQGRKIEIGAANGVHQLVGCLRKHREVTDIVNGCCAALARLSYNNFINQAKAYRADGISAVLDAMKLHRKQADKHLKESLQRKSDKKYTPG